MERRGHELVGRAIETAARARTLLAAIDGVRVLDEHVREQPSVGGWDPLRLIVDLGATGANGIEVDRDLRAAGISLEGADRTTLIPFLSIADDDGVGRPARRRAQRVARGPPRDRQRSGGLVVGLEDRGRDGDDAAGGVLRAARPRQRGAGGRAHRRRDRGALPAGHSRAGAGRAHLVRAARRAASRGRRRREDGRIVRSRRSRR